MADVLLHGVEGDDELAGDGLIRLAPASIWSTSSSRPVSGSTMPSAAWALPRLGADCDMAVAVPNARLSRAR
jgi:hypothetical protein